MVPYVVNSGRRL